MLSNSISKSINILKKNPIIILVYFVYMVFAVAVMYLLSKFIMPQNYSYSYSDPSEALVFLGKTMLYLFLMLVFLGGTALVFICGFGNMVTESVVEGKTSFASFFPGVKKFFTRVLLAGLLFMAFCIGFGTVVGMISLPFTIIYSMQNLGNTDAIRTLPSGVTAAIAIISGLLTVGLVPLVEFWLPAMFISDLGPIKGLKKGVKTGVRKYWVLLLITFVSYLPSFLYTIITSLNMNYTKPTSIVSSPWYLLICVISSIIGIIMITLIFNLYNDMKSSE